jgi:hypothetical protein
MLTRDAVTALQGFAKIFIFSFKNAEKWSKILSEP